MSGLFSDATYKRPIAGFVSSLPKCEACKLFKGCSSPKMGVDGDGREGILIVGEYPGKSDDDAGRPFAGKGGKYLKQVLMRHGIDMRKDCWLTNALICKPTKQVDSAYVGYCRPNLLKVIREKKPKAILVLGTLAVKAVVGHLWKEDTGNIARWAGFTIPNHEPNAWVCPTYSPDQILKWLEPDKKRGGMPYGDLAARRFDSHVEQCLLLASEGVPWPSGPPDYGKAVQRVLSPKEAAKELLLNMAFNGASSFDYETNMLKPDSDDAEIVCCAVSFRGRTTIAFPWTGRVVDVMRTYLKSESPKIGYNVKFEERWTKAKLGISVRGFRYARKGWCGMMAAHVADHRPDITSVKFQSFVRLGQPSYNDHIEPYLKSAGPRVPNRIREIAIDDLLRYCGMDAVLEYKVAEHQSKAFGWHKGWK